jgi:hypothetical protein
MGQWQALEGHASFDGQPASSLGTAAKHCQRKAKHANGSKKEIHHESTGGQKKVVAILTNSLSTRFLDQSKDLGKCEKVLIYVGKKAPVDLTRANYEELDGLQGWQLWVVQHKGNVIQADHLPLMKANQNVAFLETSACRNAFRANI